MVLESKGDKAIQMMVKLLQSFWKSGLITLDQMNRVSQSLHLGDPGHINQCQICMKYRIKFKVIINVLLNPIFVVPFPPQGFQRVYDELPEINLDVPHAHGIMEALVDLSYQESVITKQLRDACPSRSVPANMGILQHTQFFCAIFSFCF